MEIILENLKYESSKIDENLNNVNYTFKNSITFCSGLSGKIIKELLFQEKKSNGGYVYLSEKGHKYDIAYLSDEYNFHSEGLYKELLFLNDYYHLNYKNIDKKINDTLTIANIPIEFLSKKFEIMSTCEIKKSILAISLFINPKVLIFDGFEKGLTYKEQLYINKLISKLNKMYNKSIIIFSNDIETYLNVIKNIVIVNDGKIVFEGTNKDLYNKNLYKYIDIPNIIDFINYLDSKGHKFDKYIDIKELLKAIYRDVENK